MKGYQLLIVFCVGCGVLVLVAPWQSTRTETRAAGLEPSRAAPSDPIASVGFEADPWFEKAQRIVPTAIIPSDGKAEKKREAAVAWQGDEENPLPPWELPSINPTRKSLTPEQIAQVREICAPYDDELRALADLELSLHSQALADLWERRRFQIFAADQDIAPLQRGSRVMNTMSILVGDRALCFQILRGDYPEYDQARGQITQTRLSRSSAVRQYIDSL